MAALPLFEKAYYKPGIKEVRLPASKYGLGLNFLSGQKEAHPFGKIFPRDLPDGIPGGGGADDYHGY